MNMKWLSIVCVAACVSVQAQSLLFSVVAQSDAAAIQQMIDQLPVGRDSIATVTLSGTYTLDQSIVLPDYTRLDLSDARLELAGGANVPMIVNVDTVNGNHHIEIVGGALDGNKDGQGAGRFQGIWFVRAQEVRIMDLEVSNLGADGIRLSGGGQQTRDAVLQNLRVSGNQRGLTVMYAMRNVLVSDIYATGNEDYGVYSDHSEGLYQNICANDNDGTGIFIRNIFGGSYNNLTATRNGGIGIEVVGMVASCGSNWQAHNNSRNAAGAVSDIFFDPDASLSYGITTNTLLSNLSAGPVSHYGAATEKSAVEFGAGVREGLQISNLLEF